MSNLLNGIGAAIAMLCMLALNFALWAAPICFLLWLLGVI